jgi:hypothetical protein
MAVGPSHKKERERRARAQRGSETKRLGGTVGDNKEKRSFTTNSHYNNTTIVVVLQNINNNKI